MSWKQSLGTPLPVFCVGALAVGAWTWLYNPLVEADSRKNAEETVAASSNRASFEPVVAANVDNRSLRDRTPPNENAFGRNIAIQDSDGRSMHALHRALKRAQAGTGQARLVFFGASHVASDLFTGYVRRELQKRFGDAGPGFVLPVQPWRSYRRQGLRIESSSKTWETFRIRVNDTAVERVGIAGAAVQADKPGAYGEVAVVGKDGVGETANLFELYYLKQPRGGSVDVIIDGNTAKRISTKSGQLRAGYATFRVPDAAHTFRVEVATRGTVRLFGAAIERDVPGVIVDALGINGSRARYQLLWDDALFKEQLRRRNPDLVVIAYGTNESGDDSPLSQYETELRKVVLRAVKTVPNASCLLIGPSDRPVEIEKNVFENRPRTEELIGIQKKVAFENGCGFFDLVAFSGGSMSMVTWAAHDPPYVQPDHVHYTPRGYERLGEVLLGALLEGFGRGAADSDSESRSDK
ncbi:MAG: GDSL-type esterase/lipase family protein [Polyangiales bacterium]